MKITNEYQKLISGSLYERTPKAVFAALAVSFLIMQDEQKAWDDIDGCLLEEWRILHQQQIVPQKPQL